MKMKKVFTMVMAMALLVSASVFAQAGSDKRGEQDSKPRMEQRGGGSQQGQRPAPKMNAQKRGGIDMSKLSEAQRAELKSIGDKYKIQLSDLSLDIKKQGNIIKAEMMKDEPNKATIDSAIDAGSSLKATREKLMAEKKLAVKAVIDEATK